MKLKMTLLATAASLSILSASQSNAHNQGWYVGLEAGANWISDTDFSDGDSWMSGKTALASSLALWPTSNSVDFDTGWAALGTVGYGFEKNWRVELEVGYRSNDGQATFPYSMYPVELAQVCDYSDSCNGNGMPLTVDTQLDEWSFMANVIYDIPVAEKLDLNIGVGIGADLAKVKTNTGFEDQDWNFAYQAIVGLSYAVSDRLDLTLTYRYLNVDSPSFSETYGKSVETYNLENVEKHTVTVGLRYDLYADEAPMPPAPVAPPLPPTAEPEQFVIFFGFNKCNITAEADAVLGEAASAAKNTGSASIVIVGHTDTVGSNAYNQKLSECRANAAKSNLVSKGITEGSIATMGRGETELLVKTGDNVKEPQNRRATIDIGSKN